MKTNESKMKVTLTRKQVIDLMIALTSTEYEANDGGEKWNKLHEELKKQLEKFDEE